MRRRGTYLLRVVSLFLIIFLLVFIAFNFEAIYKSAYFEINSQPTNQEVKKSEENIALEDRMIISKIGVDAPIIWSQSKEEKQILSDLKKGIVHLSDTAMPGEKGNSFFIGHSSNFLNRGSFDTVFALLNKLEQGDQINIYHSQQEFIYEVKNKKIVSKYDLKVLEKTSGETLTLMTCWPIGTNINRLIIQADLQKIKLLF